MTAGPPVRDRWDLLATGLGHAMEAVPNGYEAARDAETAELDRECVRLWYVATSRVREPLILPRFDVPTGNRAGFRLLISHCESYRRSSLSIFPPTLALGGSRRRIGRPARLSPRKRRRSGGITGASSGWHRDGTKAQPHQPRKRKSQKSWGLIPMTCRGIAMSQPPFRAGENVVSSSTSSSRYVWFAPASAYRHLHREKVPVCANVFDL